MGAPLGVLGGSPQCFAWVLPLEGLVKGLIWLDTWERAPCAQGAPRGRPTMPSVVAFNAKGDSIAGLKAARVRSDGKKQVLLGSDSLTT